MKYLIVNGDDFGASVGITRGILEAHRHGILTSTSLMVDTPASEAAAALGRAAPGLSVGLHVDLTGEMSKPAPGLERRVAAELDRQLARFEKLMGRRPTHLDSHHNLHRDARALPHFLDLARQHGLPLREHSPVRYCSSFYGQWGGATHLEQLTTASLVRLLETEVSDGITELSCHPGFVERDFATSYAAERAVEVQTLCDPVIRQFLASLRIELVNYQELDALVEGLAGERRS